MGGLSIWHWIVVLVVVMLLFGRGKISELMGDAAKGIKAFKKGMSEDEQTTAATPADPKSITPPNAPQPAPQSQVRPETEKKVG